MSDDVVTRLNAALEGRYRIERVLGEGGMATVYLAADLRHERNVALKVLRPELSAVLGAERFLSEIKTTANLHHPHILPLFDSGEADGLLFYVMPYAEGESLRDRLDRDGPLPVSEAVAIAGHVADALEHAHSHGIIHRDIKPANILLLEGGPVIADFGIAVATAGASDQRITETGLSLGTPSYMSPEQASGSSTVGTASDTYALSCVVYEMLVGEPPHTGSTTPAILAKVLSTDPVPPKELRKTVPVHVDAAVRKALEKLPADRFSSTHAFGEALMDESFRYGAQHPVVWDGTGSVRPGRLAVLGVALVAVAAVTWQWRGPPPTEAPANLDRSVAVLPFENRSANPETYFSDGFADQLINALTRIPSLRVTSRTSSFAFRGDTVDPATIGATLGVSHLVSGSIQQAADRILVSAQLIDAQSGFILWSDTFDRNLVDIIDVQEDVAREIAQGLNVELGAMAAVRIAGPSGGNEEALDQYLRGRQLFYQRTPDSFRDALRAYERSIRADPSYAAPYAGAAAVYAVGITYAAFPPDSLYAFAGRALAYADRAIELDPTNAEAYGARGYLRVTWADWELGEQDIAAAVRLQPSWADAVGWHALHLAPLGRSEEAWAGLQESLELDPLSPGRLVGVVVPALWLRRTADAHAAVRRARTIQPDLSSVATMFEALSLLLLDRPDDCLALDLADLAAFEAMCLYSVGRTGEASARIDSLAAAWESSGSYLDADGVAFYSAWVGRSDDAVRWAERALDVSSFSYAALLWPPAVWDRIDEGDRPRVDAAIEALRSAARARVVEESQRVVFP